MPISSDTFYCYLDDEVNRFVLTVLHNQLTDAQRKVLDDMHAVLWNYVNTVSE